MSSGKYDDIINLPHHVSQTRSHMSSIERAAQFSPFAALTGYDDTISETARLTDEEIELSPDQIEELDAKIQTISSALDTRPLITVTYFIPDELKSGGAYVDRTGNVKSIDSYSKTMTFTDGTKVPIGRIISIEGEIFGEV
ncbi:MAG: YolD-like family protein [Clostridia bacterium]|nr:YolD-like family protein [Clostridia bacterium]